MAERPNPASEYHRRTVLRAAVGSVLPHVPNVPYLPSEEFTRRSAFEAGGRPLSALFERVLAPERREAPPILLKKHGFHGPPEGGGGLKEAITKAAEVGGTSYLVLSPKPEDGVVEAAHNAGMLVISRGSNEYKQDEVAKMIASYPKDAKIVIQSGNELNLKDETVNGVPITQKNMREYVYNHYVPVALAVAEAGGTILIPPTAQTVPAAQEFFHRGSFLNYLKHHPDFNRIKDHLADAAHAYIIQPGANEPIFKRVMNLHATTERMLEMQLPLYITEIGIQQSPKTIGKYSPELISREISRLLQMQLPEDLDAETIIWWIIGNTGFRKEPILPEHETMMKVFDESAWLKNPETESPWYTETLQLIKRINNDNRSQINLSQG